MRSGAHFGCSQGCDLVAWAATEVRSPNPPSLHPKMCSGQEELGEEKTCEAFAPVDWPESVP